MKEYFIRLIFGMLTLGIIIGVTRVFNVSWLLKGNSYRNAIILPIVIGGGVGTYTKQLKKKQDEEYILPNFLLEGWDSIFQ